MRKWIFGLLAVVAVVAGILFWLEDRAKKAVPEPSETRLEIDNVL